MGQNNLTGSWGEALAAKYLRKKRYKILACGYRSRFGEIDLVASDKRVLVFVEVKLRRSDSFAQAREFVDYGKQNRLRMTAACYLAEFPTERPSRFDVIEIYAPEGMDTKKPIITHLEDAFE